MALPVFSLIRGSARLLIFAAGLLLGIQLPAFVEQYSQRVDAHYLEVRANISGFQATADLLFAGDLDALVTYYRNSGDNVFSRDADSVALIVSRFRRLQAEQQSLAGDSLSRVLHVIFAADPEFIDETIGQYSYTVPLNGLAILWGAVVALGFTLLLDLLMVTCRRCTIWIVGRAGKQGTHKPEHADP